MHARIYDFVAKVAIGYSAIRGGPRASASVAPNGGRRSRAATAQIDRGPRQLRSAVRSGAARTRPQRCPQPGQAGWAAESAVQLASRPAPRDLMTRWGGSVEPKRPIGLISRKGLRANCGPVSPISRALVRPETTREAAWLWGLSDGQGACRWTLLPVPESPRSPPGALFFGLIEPFPPKDQGGRRAEKRPVRQSVRQSDSAHAADEASAALRYASIRARISSRLPGIRWP
jgi:hypothetical protein